MGAGITHAVPLETTPWLLLGLAFLRDFFGVERPQVIWASGQRAGQAHWLAPA